MGKNAVMRLGLGTEPEDEHMPGLGTIGKLLEGDTGLLFTDEPPKVVVEWFDDYVKADYARKGNLATETVELPAGPVMIKEINDDPSVAAGALEPHLRALGLPTTLQSRIPTLSSAHVVCKEGEKLDTNQAALLKTLATRWLNSSSSSVTCGLKTVPKLSPLMRFRTCLNSPFYISALSFFFSFPFFV